MDENYYRIIKKFFEDENIHNFFEEFKKMFHKMGIEFYYYYENREFKEYFYNDKTLETTIENKLKNNRVTEFKQDKHIIYGYKMDCTNVIIKTNTISHTKDEEVKEIIDIVVNIAEKAAEIKLYRINSFISPFFFEISKIFYPNSDINVALEEFLNLLEGIFGINVVGIEKGKKLYFYRETKPNEEVRVEMFKNLNVRYTVVRVLDKSIEIDKILKIAFFIVDVFLESKVLEERQKEFLEYQIISKENLTKLNRLLEKSLYKMTFISNLYKKLSLVRELKEALEIVMKFLKNEVGYEYIKIECGNIEVEDSIYSEKNEKIELEDTLLEQNIKYKIILYKQEITAEDEVYIGLIFNNSKAEIENILLYKRVEELAIIDGVTQLYIHRYFIENLDKEIELASRYGRELSLIMCDIDNFKKYNDTYGHLEGDKALYNTAVVIKDTIRKVDVACRYGGEEFIVIVPHTAIENSEKLAERIRGNIEEKTDVTVSVGVTQYIKGEHRDEFIKRVDKAMYEAKKNGKNKVIRM